MNEFTFVNSRVLMGAMAKTVANIKNEGLNWVTGPHRSLDLRWGLGVQLKIWDNILDEDGFVVFCYGSAYKLAINSAHVHPSNLFETIKEFPNVPGFLNLDESGIVRVTLDVDGHETPNVDVCILKREGYPKTWEDWESIIADAADADSWEQRIVVIVHNGNGEIAEAFSVPDPTMSHDESDDKSQSEPSKYNKITDDALHFIKENGLRPFFVQDIEDYDDEKFDHLIAVHCIAADVDLTEVLNEYA